MTNEKTQATEIKWQDYPQKQKINGVNYRVNPTTNKVIRYTGNEWAECVGDDIPAVLRDEYVQPQVQTIIEPPESITDSTIIEKVDEGQIIDELRGVILKKFVYTVRGEDVLTYAGIKQLFIEAGNMHVGEPITQKFDNFWLAKADVRNVINNTITRGVSIQSALETVKGSFLFSWNNVPGTDNTKLIDFLMWKFDEDWIEKAKIEKTNNNRTIKITGENKILLLKLSYEKNEGVLQVDGNTVYEFLAKMEKGNLNIYEKVVQTDMFAVQKATSKAIRNAIRALLPEQYILQAIAKWKKINE